LDALRSPVGSSDAIEFTRSPQGHEHSAGLRRFRRDKEERYYFAQMANATPPSVLTVRCNVYPSAAEFHRSCFVLYMN